MSIGADLLVKRLYAHGVHHIFALPGSHSITIYDAVVRHGGIQTVLVRNEQAGAFAADGYARVTGRPGVVCTTAGPGATNALTGIAEGWADTVPILLLTGQVNSDRMHEECGNYHEIDLEGLFRPITKYCGVARRVDDVPGIVDAAFAAMMVGRVRPTALIMPQDLMAADGGTAPSPRPLSPEGRRALTADHTTIRNATEVLRSARRPIILVGGGAVWAAAAAEVRTIAQRLGCSVITTLNGKGLIDERDPISLGHARGQKARAALEQADAMLAVGCRFTEVMTWRHTMKVPEKLVQIDIDADQIGMNYPVAVGIHADAKAALRAMIEFLPAGSSSDWGAIQDAVGKLGPPNPEWLIDTMRAEIPDDVPLFTDASEMALRMQTDYPAYGPRTFFYPSNYITLGWAMPAAIGAAIARDGKSVVSFSGDGGFVMTCQEMATVARYKLNLIMVIHNDSAYGAMKNIQKKHYDGRYHDVELNNPDFIKLAEAFGLPGCRVTNSSDLSEAMKRAFARGGPSLIEVPDKWRSLR